jgi:hypothetical protein
MTPPASNNPLPQIPTDAPAVCRLLRTKKYFGDYSDSDIPPWHAGASTTAIFWCLETMQSVGPDDGLVHANSCRADCGRLCFKPEES